MSYPLIISFSVYAQRHRWISTKLGKRHGLIRRGWRGNLRFSRREAYKGTSSRENGEENEILIDGESGAFNPDKLNRHKERDEAQKIPHPKSISFSVYTQAGQKDTHKARKEARSDKIQADWMKNLRSLNRSCTRVLREVKNGDKK